MLLGEVPEMQWFTQEPNVMAVHLLLVTRIGFCK